MGDTEAAPSRVPQEPPHTPFQGMETPGPAGGAPRCQCSSASAGARSGGAHIPAGTAAPQLTGPGQAQTAVNQCPWQLSVVSQAVVSAVVKTVISALVSSDPGSGQYNDQ